MTQNLRLGFGFTKKAYFVYGSMSHLSKDYTFHEDRMAKKSVLPNNVGKGTSHKESRPICNNVQRINYQNKFAPTAVFTRFGRIPVSAAKPKVATSTSAAKPVNTAGPKQTHSKWNSTKRLNTFGSKAVSIVKGNRVTTVKTSVGCVWRPRVNDLDHISKDNRDLDEFCRIKEIKREYSNARTPQKNRVTGRKNRTLTEVARTMLADSLLPITFWAEAVHTACYVLNRFHEIFWLSCHYKDELNRLISQEKEVSDAADAIRKESEQGCVDQRGATKAGSTNLVNTVSNPINDASTLGTFSAGGPYSPHPDPFILTNTLLYVDQDDSQIPDLEDTAKLRSTGIFNSIYDNDLDIFTSLV
nr:ribonuclease H-like domain-containing protein [Tanacetum cinerariifolium]